MRYTHILCLIIMVLCIGLNSPLYAQNNSCGPAAAVDSSGVTGTIYFNNGSQARSKNANYRTSISVGQSAVGYMETSQKNTSLGFFSRFQLAPLKLNVIATQGDLLDRIQITWSIDALGPSPSGGFNIYRDGVFLATVGPNIRNYNDFNVIPGTPYIYSVRGINIFGEGVPSEALGFQVPNGVVTGWIQTLNGSPVPDALVTLTPMQGFSARFGVSDGAFSFNENGQNPFLPNAGEDWTMTFWIKTESATTNASVLELSPYPLYIRAINSGSGHEGVEVSTSPSQTLLSATFPDSTKNGWHHVALSFDGIGNQSKLYIDGVLASIAPMGATSAADTLNLGSRAGNGGWAGRLDELRIYHRQLDELDFREVMEGTASSQTPFLSHYWKMDEELGEKSYDITHRQKLYFCGAHFDAQRPPVRTAGKTNSDGYYSIESANYGTGTTFLAKPKKDFYLHRSLRFRKNEGDYASLPNFSITPKATFELWVNSSGPNGTQCLLSKKWGSNEFRILLVPNGLDNQINVNINGTLGSFGNLGTGFQHLAFTWNGLTGTLTGYKNGVLVGSKTYSGATGDWSDAANGWVLGAQKTGASNYAQFFGGLMDEFAVYDTTLSTTTILAHVQGTRDMQENGLRVYFPMDEGSGINLGNIGSAFLNPGTIHGAEWSNFAAQQMTEPHVFTPNTRQVTLNPSVTSVDQVDFKDQSTVPVSGFVRYKDTDCFAKNVEILVNGASFNPKIMTDSTGRFVVDFDPGATAKLTPKFENHVFVPAFWDVTNVTSPIAGILFNDVTTRKISGQVAGGFCKKSIIKAPPGQGQGTVCVVKVSTPNLCLVRTVTIDNQEGAFEFDNLPPIENMMVAVVEHSEDHIKTAFEDQGGSTVDLSARDTMIDFIYFAPPQPEIVSGLDPVSPTCNTIVLDQYEQKEVAFKLKEQYEATLSDNGVCYIDSAAFRIINGFSDETIDTAMSNGLLVYQFRVATPNPSPPFLKTLQIISTTLDGNEGELTVQAVVTGVRTKENTFTTKLPETPTVVLRDPPGDGSYAFLEKDEKICQKLSFETEVTTGGGLATIIDFGPDVEVPTFFGAPDVDIESEIGPTIEATTTIKKITANSMEVCTSLNERLATNSGELIVGGAQGADIFMGGGLNVEFGFADVVEFDVDNCLAENSIAVLVAPGDYATTYLYSEFNIRNQIIRFLQNLADNEPDPIQQGIYLESIERWNKILDDNVDQKTAAQFLRNISFDAGVSYEYSETSDTTTSQSTSSADNTILNVDISNQIYAQGIGGGVIVKVISEGISGESEEGTSSKSIKTGYVLEDNEPGDGFSVDVAMDSVYKTPVFRLKAGQSSCPWEAGTANREAPNLQLAPGSQFTAIDVPANEPAVFQLKLGNLSASNEDWTYGFSAMAANNPNGAVIKLNGQPLNYTQLFIIPYGTSQTVTLTVERGPIEYDYDSLLVALYSDCEYQRHLALSIPVASDPNFFSPIYLGAHFIRPCSEVNITVPEQDWVLFPDPLTPGPDDIRRITVSGYDTTEVDFQLIRVQYRRTDGDGAWINIPGISDIYNPMWSGFAALPLPKPPTLGQSFTQFFWDTQGLSDGDYEIRAVSVCTGDASDAPGYSQIIKGRIDRQPPSLVGLPQPSDGVYQVGDEISFTFNQDVNCTQLIQADMVNANNVGLYDATTNTLIDVNITCVGNKIVIDPLFQNAFYENHILRAELHNIEDLTGNMMIDTLWEFYVDRNELAWLTDSIGMTKFADENKSIIAKIHNRGGYPVPFTIQNIPSWVNVAPSAGTLVANEIRDIVFTVDSTVARGEYADSIILHTETGQNPFFMGGDEGLPLGVRVLCRPPNWNINPAAYQLTMNMNIRLVFGGVTSTDPEDEVGVFIAGQLRGKGKPVYLPAFGYWVAFVTIYGNAADEGKPLVFEMFDASECLHYPGTFIGNFTFVSNSVIGTAAASAIITSSSSLLREIPLKTGWNWISFNLGFPNAAINSALANIPNPLNDLIKDQTKFATFTNPGWSGALNTLTNKSLYLYQANQPNTLKIIGTPLAPANVPIPVVAGWNWIGYVPNYQLPVNSALATLSAQPGDIIKSQTAFAQYVNAGTGWVGSLSHLSPPQGYMLKLAQAGTLTYPPSINSPEPAVEDRNGGPAAAYWTVDATQYEHSMTLIGMFRVDNADATTATMELGAFAGDEIRGTAQAVYVESLQSYLFFLTSYANTSGEQFHFKLYDAATETVLDLSETMDFSPNLHQGSVEGPLPFTLQSASGTGEASTVESFEVQPNPFQSETVCRITLSHAQEIQLSIRDVNGKEVSYIKALAHQGLNAISWNGLSSSGSPLSSGVYFVRLKTEQGTVTKKVVMQQR
jgi:Concanavalin A-like lectin/glucanases superfamily/Secretion system C-terminal sorting domain